LAYFTQQQQKTIKKNLIREDDPNNVAYYKKKKEEKKEGKSKTGLSSVRSAVLDVPFALTSLSPLTSMHPKTNLTIPTTPMMAFSLGVRTDVSKKRTLHLLHPYI
jgi:hypothetical protein